jgi:YVTN family beta-propeller protein
MKLSMFSAILLFLALCSHGQRQSLPLKTLRDIPLSGGTTRFDYQSFDESSGRLYIAHLGSDVVTVFDTKTDTQIGDVKGIKRVHGVLAVPELHRVYASATGTNELVVIDDNRLEILARVEAGDYPDGIAYAAREKKLYVSDLHGKTDTVIDAQTNKVITTIPLGGGAGNTQYDPVLDRIYVTVHGKNELAEIDPNKDHVTSRYPLSGCSESHGLLIDAEDHLAFVACEGNARLGVFDLNARKVTATYTVGDDPDVLAFDRGLGRLYVSAESGTVTVFGETGRTLNTLGREFFAKAAHSVSVDQKSHRVFFPLEDVNGQPVLRVAVPTDVLR